MINTFVNQGYIEFRVTICKPESGTSTNNQVPTSTDNIAKEPTTNDLNEAQRVHEDVNRRCFSNEDMDTVRFIDTTSDDGSVATAGSRYREGHEPKTFKQHGKALTERVIKINGFPTTSTPLASTLNKKELMKNPPLTLLNDTNGITFLQGLQSHGQSNGCFVPSLREIKADTPMGTAWPGMTMTHSREDEMSTALFALLHLL